MNFSKAEIYVVNNSPREGYGTAFTDSLSDEQDLSNTLALAFDFANKWDFVILKFTDEIGGYWRVLSFDHRSPSGEKTGNLVEEKASAMLQRKEEAKACATLHEIEIELYDRAARHGVRFLGFHSQAA